MSITYLTSKSSGICSREALKEQQKEIDQMEKEARSDLIFAPDSTFADRVDAVITDMMAGRHSSQLDPNDNL